MSQNTEPSAPPSYAEAMGNVASAPRDQNISSLPPVTDAYQEENELKKKELKKEAPPLATAPPPPVTNQPQPGPETTYSFQQPVTQQPQSTGSFMCCYVSDGQEISDLCYCIFCCARHTTGHDAGCCHCEDDCCSCPDGCCECGGCDCGDCDCGGCDCGDCDCGGCDCGDCDCGGCDCGNCDCGDCTIM